jgi:LPS sulfotransferase NodH
VSGPHHDCPSGRSRLSTITPLFPDESRRVQAGRSTAAGGGELRRPLLSCFLATLPRSGSWLLAELLWNTGLAGEPHEYFRPDFTALWGSEWGLPSDLGYTDYVRAAVSLTQTPNGVFCAKVHWYQFAWLRQQLAEQASADQQQSALGAWFPDLRHVFLHRSDTARQAISYYLAAKTQVWFWTGGRRPGPGVSEPDLQQVRWFEDVLVQHGHLWRDYFARSGAKPLEIRYEDLAADPPGTVNRVLEFLGVSQAADPPRPPTLKPQSDDSTERILEAYLEARDRLAPLPTDLVWNRTPRKFQHGSSSEGRSLERT